jgi:putative membrane protein
MKKYLVLMAKGLAMGAADVVPGVSGGTIAFISGIYETLLASIASVNFGLVKILRTEGFKGVWNAVNGSFLLPLFAGIALSILTLSKAVTYLMDHEPIGIWSFFFGLVLSSIVLVVRMIKKPTTGVWILGIAGIAFAYWITALTPSTSAELGLPYLFFCGVIAICAMILPGISGSFILVLLGAYRFVLDSLHERNLAVMSVFAAGALIGITSFSHVLKWLFAKYHDLTVACLAGFMLGSLAKVWPWRSGGTVDRPASPWTWAEQGMDPQWVTAVGFAVLGTVLVLGLEYWGNRRAK